MGRGLPQAARGQWADPKWTARERGEPGPSRVPSAAPRRPASWSPAGEGPRTPSAASPLDLEEMSPCRASRDQPWGTQADWASGAFLQVCLWWRRSSHFQVRPALCWTQRRGKGWALEQEEEADGGGGEDATGSRRQCGSGPSHSTHKPPTGMREGGVTVSGGWAVAAMSPLLLKATPAPTADSLEGKEADRAPWGPSYQGAAPPAGRSATSSLLHPPSGEQRHLLETFRLQPPPTHSGRGAPPGGGRERGFLPPSFPPHLPLGALHPPLPRA